MRPATRRRVLGLFVVSLLALAVAVILWLPPPGQGRASDPVPLSYVGRESCAGCHPSQVKRWRGSDHALAMQEASERTVLGDFRDRSFAYAGVTSRFYLKDGRFFVRTDGPDGRLADYEIRRTFGVSPLQQYLVELAGGRYQALSIAWDSRPRARGGQRWFHLHPRERAGHRSVLHWTKLSRNWNSQCAECHSTDLHKNYRPGENRFLTAFSEIDVSCEACHGPASRHVAWAALAKARGRAPSGDPGLVVRFEQRRSRRFEMDEERGIARPTAAPPSLRVEVETCARCHARRRLLSERYQPGRLLAQTHQPALLEEGLYYADGQMRDEVYSWGSFLQSRMYAAGVTCSDCHDPHDLKLRAPSDQVCATCHMPQRFATRRHHFHAARSQGASCIACHMRTETYMVVDPRHDHSFRVPRPDLTVALGSAAAPNACNDCHRDRSAHWAAAAVRRFYPAGRQTTPHYASALEAGRHLRSGAGPALVALLRDRSQPGIVRGTAASLLGPFLSPSALRALASAVKDEDPLVRLGVASMLEALAPAERLKLALPLVWDEVRAVRVEAVPAFAGVDDSQLESEARAAFDRALDEFFVAQRANAERPEAHVALGRVEAKRGRLEEARRAYQTALRIGPWFVPAYVNLADLLRQQGHDAEAESLLRRALLVAPADAEVLYSLGLLHLRQKRREEGIAELGRAAAQAPRNPAYAVAYAEGLRSIGRTSEALPALRRAAARMPAAREVLTTLVTMSREAGHLREARAWGRRLAAEAPDDPAVGRLLASMGPKGTE
jgi:tetratricopeptide (TPR) repeat protein